MIKLIVTDLDGTLLAPDGTLPPSFFPLLEQLHQKKIHFAVATGRQVLSCEKLFAPSKDAAKSLYFITQNGSSVYQNGRQLAHSPLPRPLVGSVLSTIFSSLTGVIPILFTSTYGYVQNSLSPQTLQELKQAHVFCKTTPSLETIAQTKDIVRITLRDSIGTSVNGYPLLSRLVGQAAQVTMASPLWMDLVAQNIHKGAALAALQQTLGVTPEETVAFGDYHNDITLLQQASYSYAMANACPEAKKTALYTCPSNEKEGVLQILRQLLANNLVPPNL